MNSENFPDFFTENLKQDIPLDSVKEIIPLLENKIDYGLFDQICSPVQNNDIDRVLVEYLTSISKGTNHLKIMEYQQKHGDIGFSTNICIPIIEQENPMLPGDPPIIKNLVILSNEQDCENIAQNHLKKMPNFKPIVLDSIISTTNNNHWKNQRQTLNPAFIPSNLSEDVFIKSNKLAQDGVEKLLSRINISNHSLDLNEFLLELTQEQLQKVLLGLPEEFSDKTNKKIRNALNGKGPRGYTRDYTFEIIAQMADIKLGPVGEILKKSDKKSTELYGNLILLSFAGHDTTGHTLTWLLYELSKNKHYFYQLRNEIDHFWANHQQDSFKYSDLKKLKFMTKCIHETLRLWPAVANGTFRELETDDYIIGKNDSKVLLKKGTYVQILNWSRHRNQHLWGNDAQTFNPNRDWGNDEIWQGSGLAGYNPSSKRFSPFTYGPRDCLGKNFAQLEMRLILLYLIKEFDFDVDLGTLEMEQTGLNRATLAPINLYENQQYPETCLPVLETGCWFYVTKRSISKL